jgi:putative transposase
MSRLAGVSRAGFYRQWEAEAPAEAKMVLRDAVQRAALEHRSYGCRRLAAVLRRQGVLISPARALRLMREDNLLAVRKRKFVVTTDGDHDLEIYPNLARHLQLSGVNQLWVADISYLRLGADFVYLAVVLDAFSRRVVGWALGRTLQTTLPLLALNRAIEARQPGPGLVHHSDRGSQYASADYVSRLEEQGMMISMSRPGKPWENARCESFLRTLKREEIDARPYNSLEELEQNVEQFIEEHYNCRRLHSALGYCSPEEFEAQAGASTVLVPPLVALSFLRHQEIYPDA